ncbi:hypothetical protein ABIA33_001413 [Streptacidiphilus sp. MAP12-16]|uniref:TadE/TadG family type IV pilus assembly protein n=1 Tax=Streptacidiphilus sp. MAP12-16 TaxID=3156300 RepID=UPI003512569B
MNRPAHRPHPSAGRRSAPRPGPDTDQGSVTAFTAVVFLALLGFAGLVVDGGMALDARVQALGQAEDAARAGAGAIDTEALRLENLVALRPEVAQQRALDYLSGSAATGTALADTQSVTVTVTVHTPTHLLSLFGVPEITECASATAHPVTQATP